MYRAVDCQGFAGGFTLGMVQAGFTLVGKREMKGGFGVQNCERNRHLLGDTWRSEVGDYLSWSSVDADVVFGNPPCSGFSVMSDKNFRGAESKINQCMWAFVHYVAKVKPQIAVFESVPLAVKEGAGRELMRALREDLEKRTGQQWDLYHVKHNAYSVGGAAQRRRYFWVVSRIPFGVSEPQLRKLPTLNDAISDLVNLSLTWQPQAYRAPATWWSSARRSPRNAVDGHVNIVNPLARRIYDLIKEVPWHPREGIQSVCRRYYEKHGRLPKSWEATEAKLIKQDFFQGFTTAVRWDGTHPARVITGGSLLTVIHPTLDRLITHREAARILGFPDDWLISPLRGVSGLAMTWGKGITVDCGRWIGEWIISALKNEPGDLTGKLIGDREHMIDVTNSYRHLV